ncbi:hypothetical protein RFI_15658, partial [Reticulomyxa filosa]
KKKEEKKKKKKKKKKQYRLGEYDKCYAHISNFRKKESNRIDVMTNEIASLISLSKASTAVTEYQVIPCFILSLLYCKKKKKKKQKILQTQMGFIERYGKVEQLRFRV